VGKLTNNLLANAILVASAEALTLGVKAGLSLETMLEVMRTTAATNWALFEAFPKRAFRGNTVPAGFMLRLANKDVHLALGMADRHDVEAPMGAATGAVLQHAIAENLGREDITAVLKLNERQAGAHHSRRAWAAGQAMDDADHNADNKQPQVLVAQQRENKAQNGRAGEPSSKT
jgi:4-hydroxybutyrate dehydrogenase/sulfolactaldehyde 3-reductase